ncbi:Soluble quinoprotein glucose/sorbosone dehydrogenase [Niveomyces insectorum RCEF 264]|uniref:Soluble quinoprotein glucose/sorbosone dehydrogenase n=1 Tax=Niveomyces insectorum RCEF 264 TaxID=1081102 RepID=A0A167PWE4_9HYPO|nr:Soluble quinoprotein glucose/sorbosone dehydrogenase [Niveomyces insectorum RCEF 264]
MRFVQVAAGAVAALLAGLANAEIKALPLPATCSGVPAAHFPAMTVAEGWKVLKIVGGLHGVRTIIWDPLGHMLVSQAGRGISVHTFGTDGCVNSTTMLISNIALNQGLALTPDGKTLYASSERTAFSWTYDAATMKVSNQKTAIAGMDSGIHSTRNLLVATGNPNMVMLQVGANANFDYAAADKATGRAIIKIFDMSKAPATGFNYKTDGEVLAYGLRNEIGFVADPNGHVWGVENSGDDFTRTVNGRRTDIHKDNPAEKMNYFGDPLKVRNVWYGYPQCFTVWDPSAFSDNKALKTGSHFVLAPNSSYSDDTCNGKAQPPRLVFQAHSAPIFNTFDTNATNMYVTFHGSWDRQPPTGFKVVQIPFTKLANGNYDPVAPVTSMKGYNDIWSANNPGSCTANGLTQSNCIRLTASAWDPAGRGLFVGSDNAAEGEIFILSPPK